VTPLLDLARQWRDRARDPFVSDDVREVVERCAGELERAVHKWETEALTVARWASEHGYAESTVRSMLSDGRLENVGEPYRPRIRRCDRPDGARGPESVDEVDEAIRRMA